MIAMVGAFKWAIGVLSAALTADYYLLTCIGAGVLGALGGAAAAALRHVWG